MTITEAIVAGIVLGITEFLPVSGSGHLAILENLFGIADGASGVVLKVFIHLGAAGAVVLLYWQELKEIIFELLAVLGNKQNGFMDRKRYPYARIFIMLLVSTIPLLFLVPLKKYADQLSDNNIFVGISLILTGAMLYVTGRFIPNRKTEKNMTVLDAAVIGICQCVAVIPGFSRSGTVITAGLAVGLDKNYAVRYSLLLSIPVIIGAQVYDLINTPFYFEISYLPACLIGAAAAFVCGIASVLLLKKMAGKGSFSMLSNYSMVIGVLFIILTVLF